MGGMEVGSIGATAPTWRPIGRRIGCIASAFSSSMTGPMPASKRISRRSTRTNRLNCKNALKSYLDANQHVRCRQGTITVDPVRARAFEANLKHYADVFANGNPDYAIPHGRPGRSGEASAIGRLFLLDLVGGIHQSARRRSYLHKMVNVLQKDFPFIVSLASMS